MSGDTLIHPKAHDASGAGTRFGRSRWSLPPDLLRDTRQRLRAIALLLAFVFLMADFVAAFVAGPDSVEHLFSRPALWLPGAVSIVIALAVALVCGRPSIPAHTLVNLGLVFEVVTSFGIAAAEYPHVYAPMQYQPGEYGGLGLSWVSVWVLLFTVVVPTPPRKAVVAALASASAVPITIAGAMSRADRLAIAFTAREFFVAFVLPYLLVVLMAYVGARVVYRLGTAISRARELGSYRLVRPLGQGGMGEVWLARHRMLARPAAIKLVKPEVLGASDPTVRETSIARFEREAQATASMRCPHTVDLFDFGVTDDGTFYYAMELLDGYDLDTLVDRFGPVPPERAIHLLRQVCHSLAEAHERGLIHRDVKPANIYACRYGRDLDHVKVLDFGLVKTRQGADDPRLTRQHTAGGTPAHMAPEQALGEDAVDGRTDLYAVGCVAYWLVTGRLVFESDSPLGMMADHARTPPIPPSKKTDLEIPADLERVIMRCLEKDPADRPQTADELAAALAACERARAWTRARAEEWWELHGPPASATSEETGAE